MTIKKTNGLVRHALILWAFFVLTEGSMGQAVPQVINFQAVLQENTAGGYQPLVGVQEVIFRIYDSPTHGNLQWGREFPVFCNEEGVFNLLLTDNGTVVDKTGDAVLRDVFASSNERYMEIEVVGQGGPVLPRQPILAVPYAIEVDKAKNAGAVRGDFRVMYGMDVQPVTDDGSTFSFETSGTSADAHLRVGSGTEGGFIDLSEASAVVWNPWFQQSPFSIGARVCRATSDDESWAWDSGYDMSYEPNGWLVFFNDEDIKIMVDQEEYDVDDVGTLTIPMRSYTGVVRLKNCEYGFSYWPLNATKSTQ